MKKMMRKKKMKKKKTKKNQKARSKTNLDEQMGVRRVLHTTVM